MKKRCNLFALACVICLALQLATHGLADAAPPATEQEVSAALKAENPNYNGKGRVLTNKEGIIWGLELANCKIDSINSLKGMKLEALVISDNPIKSLAPVKGMKLYQLLCANTGISDLSPIAGMPIWKLDIGNTEVADISALKGMPLQVLMLSPSKISKGVDVLKGNQALLINVVDPKEPDPGPVRIVIKVDEFLKNFADGKYRQK